ncbi:Tubulin alpha-8 chain [Ooceraea biroi]|uniref:Tubulin alpha chain n=1 Tax=Ooceraea biroi TaxID=2015173 RepID=A0A026VV87_OOCBI|nr:Tubulin alpha-8 chain [Ooceraea biroi]
MDTINEIVTIFVGQAGTQVSSACWELFCLEHGIEPNGSLYQRYKPPDNSYQAFFAPSQNYKLTPRTVIVDLEPTVINEIRTGAYKHLFDPASLITGKEDAANNFARGYYTIGRRSIDITLDQIRTTCENCSNLGGFLIFRSLSGGTGSGFTTLLLEHLDNAYKTKPKLEFAIHPAPDISSITLEPYNSVLSIHGSMDYKNCSFVIDNQALYNICERKLNVQSPTYENLNRLQAQVVSSITTSMRFGRNLSLQKMCINLIPVPKMHFVLIAYAPFISPKERNMPSPKTITFDCFNPQNQMAMCDPSKGLYMSCYLLYRGKSHEIHKAISLFKKERCLPFVKWIPNTFKREINCQPPITVPSGDIAIPRLSVANLSNSTAIKQVWANLAHKFDLMYQKRAFLHHYLNEGMEEDIFESARANMKTIHDEYVAIET